MDAIVILLKAAAGKAKPQVRMKSSAAAEHESRNSNIAIKIVSAFFYRLVKKDDIWISPLQTRERQLAAKAREHEKRIYDRYAAQWMLLKRYISIKSAISRGGGIFPESETTDLLGAHSTDVEMDFLMHFGALLNRLMPWFVEC
ncbi:hypothetical protein CEXT_353731 [Caerostris extrusa]|uniref:Uncharacterized protein n=1 Tax=Caerostris extrusa TaxID=172846 RepID=A0AAV4QPP3_CAEEX|nr:hypothetical protein CEXT_353731 [Caerostris extrusa]